MEALILVADLGGPTMFARIGIMRALDRHVERVFNPDRKDHHWASRTHPQHLGDVGHRGLLVADFAEQTLRHRVANDEALRFFHCLSVVGANKRLVIDEMSVAADGVNPISLPICFCRPFQFRSNISSFYSAKSVTPKNSR